MSRSLKFIKAQIDMVKEITYYEASGFNVHFEVISEW